MSKLLVENGPCFMLLQDSTDTDLQTPPPPPWNSLSVDGCRQLSDGTCESEWTKLFKGKSEESLLGSNRSFPLIESKEAPGVLRQTTLSRISRSRRSLSLS